MHDVGFEVRHEENLREHYALTTGAWSANLDAHWDESVAEIGLAKARTWRLYLAGSPPRLRAQHRAVAPGARGQAARGRELRHATAPRLDLTAIRSSVVVE
jgi:hypothetical protein